MIMIFYPPGARGDFLASVLLDTISETYTHWIVPTPANYKKIHWHKDLVGVPTDIIDTSIRIRLNDIEDFLTVTYLWQEKISFGQIPTENILVDLIQNEHNARHMDHLFDHIVDFKSLFDVGFMQSIYKKINNREMDDLAIQQTQYNISLQRRVYLSML